MANGSVINKIFPIDNSKEYVKYKIGDYVKIVRFRERFWCKIIDIKYGTIIAKVDNDLLNDFIQCGDYMCFQPEEILARTSSN